MSLISLPVAWQWLQIGFCAALGGSVVLVFVTVVTNLTLAGMFLLLPFGCRKIPTARAAVLTRRTTIEEARRCLQGKQKENREPPASMD